MRSGPLALAVLALAACERSTIDTAPSALDLVNAPGKTIAEGRNLVPSGPFGLVSYRIEGVQLRGTGTTRLTVTGGPFIPGDLPWIIWLDGVRAGSAGENRNLSGLVLLLDRSGLRSGARLEVSRGNSGDRSALTETLNLP